MELALIEELEKQVENLEKQLNFISNPEDKKPIQRKLQAINFRLSLLYGDE